MDLTKSVEEFTKKHKELEKKVKQLTTDLQNLKRDVKKLSISRGSKYLPEFMIEGKDQWDLVEKALIQQGSLLEYGISKKLDNEQIENEQNITFLYPNEQSQFYIDYFFSKNISSLLYNFKDGKEIQTAEFETDITVDENEIFEDDNFIITLKLHYFIECKSRTNPPVNYIIILNNFLNQKFENIKSILRVKGSKLIKELVMETNTLWSTRHKPLQLTYSKFKIDDKKNLKEAFWELFRRIDYECNSLFFENEIVLDDLYSNIEVPKEMELPRTLSIFNEFYDEWIKKDLIPSRLKEKIKIDVSIFIPIIVVNGNIYSIDLDSPNYTSFEEITKRIPGFIREFSYLRQGLAEHLKYVNLSSFIMKTLGINNICFKEKTFFPSLNAPILDIIVLSSKDFIEVFKKIKDEIKTAFYDQIKKHASTLYLDKKDELLKFQVLKWSLFHSRALLEDLLLACYQNYYLKKR